MINKFLGAVLGTCLVLLVMNFVAKAIFAPHVPAKPGFKIAVKEDDKPAASSKDADVASAVSLGKRLQAASVENGAIVAKKCAACHTLEKGGPTASVLIFMASSASRAARVMTSISRLP